MTIAQRIGVVRADIATATAAGEFASLARSLAIAGSASGVLGALRHAESNGATPRVVEILRAASAAGSTSDWGSELVAYRQIAGSFLESMARNSAFEAIRVAGGWRTLPLNTRIGAVTSRLIGARVFELQSKPISRLSDGIQLSQSSQADVQLDSAPTDPPTAPTSLWQTNSTALRAERRFVAEALSPSAIAFVTDIGGSA